jgi:hypothetical protein
MLISQTLNITALQHKQESAVMVARFGNPFWLL